MWLGVWWVTFMNVDSWIKHDLKILDVKTFTNVKTWQIISCPLILTRENVDLWTNVISWTALHLMILDVTRCPNVNTQQICCLCSISTRKNMDILTTWLFFEDLSLGFLLCLVYLYLPPTLLCVTNQTNTPTASLVKTQLHRYVSTCILLHLTSPNTPYRRLSSRASTEGVQ